MKPTGTLYPMECSATVYPYLATKTVNQIFCMEADLDTQIDPARLKTVAQKLCERFPTMFVRLYKDAFGYKLEHVRDVTPFICPRPQVLCQPFDLKNNDHLMRISYAGNRLGVEFFHSLCDGNGGITFLKSLIAEYYRSLGEEIPCAFDVRSADDAPTAAEIEDSFEANCDKSRKPLPRSGKKAFQYCPDGPFSPWHQTELTVPLDKLKALAKEKNVTITEYLAALYLLMLASTEQGQKRDKPIALSVPINLRPIYGSGTLRNFSLFFLASVPETGEITFDTILENVHRDFTVGSNKELLADMIRKNVADAHLPVFVYAPRPVKKAILKIGAAMYGENLYSSTLSNLGVIRMPEELGKHVLAFRPILGESPVNHVKMTLYSYNGAFHMMISSRLVTREPEERFQKLLEQFGLPVTAEPHS